MSIVTYYMNSYDKGTWSDVSNIYDGDDDTYGYSDTGGEFSRSDDNSCPGTNLGTITKVEMRLKGYYTYSGRAPGAGILWCPGFTAGYGTEVVFILPTNTGAWSSYEDITEDTNAPANWTWSEVSSLDSYIESDPGSDLVNNIYCSIIEIRVTYTPSEEGVGDCNNPGDIALNANSYGNELYVQSTNYGNELRQHTTCS